MGAVHKRPNGLICAGSRVITIVAGSRDFTDYIFLKKVLTALPWRIEEVVSGGARGADTLGERYARENQILFTRFPAKWDLYGKRAGYLRNEEMARYSEALVVFRYPYSRGSAHMLEIAKRTTNIALIKDVVLT